MSRISANARQLHTGDFAVDVIVPVYAGLRQTRACIESVLANPQTAKFELIVINDCSPEPELTAWLERTAASGEFTLLGNPVNTGFVQTVNRGMAIHPHRDVILLNSDTVVANDWLDRMVNCAYAEARIATATPFSNNATICSYPRFCEDNELPAGLDAAALDAIFAQANRGGTAELPTGVGYCLYIRRAAIDELGLFDARSFGKGYGEENDFCQRAIKAGWKNVLAADVFVQHSGGVSFAGEQATRKSRALKVLTGLHPNYAVDVQNFIAADSVRRFRLAVDFYRLAAGELPVILAISHDRGGGTQKHIDDLARRLVGKAHCLLLRPVADGRIALTWNQPGEGLHLYFDIGANYALLLETLSAAGVCRVHFHTLVDVPVKLKNIAQDLHVPYDFTAHDYYPVCPKIDFDHALESRYCGERGEAQCKACLQVSPALSHVDISTWRSCNAEMLEHASRILAPSGDVANRLRRYFPQLEISVAPHPEPVAVFPRPRKPVRVAAESPSRIFVLGALTKMKGADFLETCAMDAAQRNLPLHFELIGFSYRKLMTIPGASLRVHGRYADAELQSLLEYHVPDLIWFPAQSPETYSYTLSAALAAALPVAAPNLGAFPERLAGRPWSWIYDFSMTPVEINDWLVSLRKAGFINGTEVDSPKGEVTKPSIAFDYPDDYLHFAQTRNRTAPVDGRLSALAEKICERDRRDRILQDSFRADLDPVEGVSPRRVEAIGGHDRDSRPSPQSSARTVHALPARAASSLRELFSRYPRLGVAARRTVKLVWWSITFQLLEKYRWRREQLASRPHFPPPTDEPDSGSDPQWTFPQMRLLRQAHRISVYHAVDFSDFVNAVTSLAAGESSIIDFDETFYLASNPDVNEAVKNGGFPCGFIHFCMGGASEGRTWRRIKGTHTFSERPLGVGNTHSGF